MSTTTKAFLLTHGYRDRGGRLEIELYAKGAEGAPVLIRIDNFRPVFFIPPSVPETQTGLAIERKPLPLKSIDREPVDCLYFRSQNDLLTCARRLRESGYRTYESDIHPVDRYLMERMIYGGMSIEGKPGERNGILVFRNPRVRGEDYVPSLSALSFDIETCAATNELYSVASAGTENRVFIIGEGNSTETIEYLPDEKTLLHRFMDYLVKTDPDILAGWNVIDFDLVVLQQRCDYHRIRFTLGRGGTDSRILPPSNASRGATARIPGRAVFDMPSMLRSFHRTFERYSLDFVASRILGEHKLIKASGAEKIAEIDRLFAEDKPQLAEYNLKDATLTLRIMEQTETLPNAIARTRQSGHLLDRSGGSVAAFDYLYLPRMHRRGFIARDVLDVPRSEAALPGGYVMESKPGIYENVLLLDFKSLYPTIIMTFCIDPLGAVEAEKGSAIHGPVGPPFQREKPILPTMIRRLMAARAEAKKTGNSSLSQATKILMNSFYGVLGSPGCRFFSPELAHTITGTGQYILKTTCAHIEQTTGFPVIYGDTDSLFILLGPDHHNDADTIGGRIVEECNTWLSRHLKENFDAESMLELEFESRFHYFFMPTIRGSSQGSKKRYCGAIKTDHGLELTFKGLESVRSDWTELAKRFQKELYLRVFEKRPVEEYIVKLVQDVKAGRYDEQLVYRKGLRKSVDEYTDHAPPHVQAARLLKNPGSHISYFITVEGPQPRSAVRALLDYDHYIEAQLRPVADAILDWVNLDFDSIVSGQTDLFGGL